MTAIEICVDVPDLGEGERYFREALGLEKVSDPYPGVAALRGEGMELTLLEKAEGSEPAPDSDDRRRYSRHWTPVHLDFHVGDLETALARALAAGARQESEVLEGPGSRVVFCSDPFGHGFCLLARKRRGTK